MVDRVSAARFIGREHELAELEAALGDAGDGRPTLVFVAGESGVGKTRLLREFERHADAAGARVLGGDCIDLGDDELPYAPLVGALRPLARGSDRVIAELPDPVRVELARLAPELDEEASDRADEQPGEAQRRLFDALLTLLERLGQVAPTVFSLEDLHWADRSTRAFLSFLATSLRGERVLVVCTYRTDELHRRHPLRPLLAELERGECAKRLELRPFDRAELEAQLTDILGGPPDDEITERLFNRSEGNPLFTEELLAGGLDGRGSLPPTLREALLTRLERLPEAAHETLSLLSVAGRADDATLAAAGELDPPTLRGALREALAAHVISADDGGRFAFRHALFREVLYDDLLQSERTELHLRLARTLESNLDDAGGPWLSTAIAHHYHAAGEQSEALRAAVRAATALERVHANGEAAALLDRALALWPRVDDPESLLDCDHPTLISRAAHAHYLGGDDARAAALHEQAVGELDAEREPLRTARTLGYLAGSQWSLGMADQSRATLQRALALLPDEPTEESARLLALEVRFLLLQGRFGEVEPVARRALEMADALGLADVRAGVLNRLGAALLPLGDEERGEELLREAIELARRGGSNDDLATAYVNYADSVHVVGRTEEAAEIIARAAAEVVPGDRSALWVALLRAEIAFELGDWAAAATVPATRGGLRGATLANSLLRHAEQALGRGDIAAARDPLERARNELITSIEPQYIAAVGALAAELETREGDTAAAREVVDEALDRIEYCTEDTARLARISAVGVAVEADAAQRARDLGDAEAEAEARARAEIMLARTEAAVENADRPVERARLATARAEAARALDDSDAGERWADAAATWSELHRPYQAAVARWREAEARLAADDRDGAVAPARAALAGARELGSRWLQDEVEALAARARLRLEPETKPARDQADADPFGLTDRERQVLALVAAGATNREIAGRLFMAEKTASVHVSRILAKLDVRSRTEAAAVAHRQGLAGEPEVAS